MSGEGWKCPYGHQHRWEELVCNEQEEPTCRPDITNGVIKRMREFTTGATRDSDDTKHEYSGFNCPLVEKRFAEYMTLHRRQSDGKLRSSSNWKRGIPKDVYLQSLHRHFVDLWLCLDGYPQEATELDIETILCAIRFNSNGLLHEHIKERLTKDLPEASTSS